jgi:integrase
MDKGTLTNAYRGFCTRLHQKGVGPFTIKDLAGHKSLNTTMRYIKIEDKEQAEAIDRLEFGTLNLWL